MLSDRSGTECLRVLDAKGVLEPYREPRQSRGWLTLLLGMLVFAVFGVVVGYAYFKGMPGIIGGEPPLIRAETEPYRHAPSDRGGLEVANVSSSIVSVLRPDTPPPRVEQLLPQEPPVALDAAEPELEPSPPAAPPAAPPAEDTPAATPPAAPVAPAEPAVAAAPDAAAPAEPDGGADAVAAEDAPPVATGVPIPLPKPAPPQQLAAREPPAAVRSVPRPGAESAAPAAPAAPRRVNPPPTAEEPAPGNGPRRLARAEPTGQPAAASPLRSGGLGGTYRLQLTAVRSETGLTAAWADLRERYPRALAAVSPKVERTETGSGPLFRLQAGPFSSREAAANACGTIRSSGGQCFIVGPIGP
jgi:SPOR domain